jgi:hypothetical protein
MRKLFGFLRGSAPRRELDVLVREAQGWNELVGALVLHVAGRAIENMKKRVPAPESAENAENAGKEG